MNKINPSRTVKDLQVVTGLGRDAVKAAVLRGDLPGSKIGDRYVIPADAFDAYCLAGRWPVDQLPTPIRPIALIHRKERAS